MRKFDDYPVYYSGGEVAGQPLGQVLEQIFVYGECDPRPTENDGGCPYPLEIHNYDICERWPGKFNQDRELYDLRGAKARGGGADIEDALEIFTGRTAVTISSEDQEIAKAAARQLRNVRQARPSSLPPPVPGSLAGKLPCQEKSGK